MATIETTPALAHEGLTYYVIDTGNVGFRLQHVVDGAAAETATAATKPITIVFALLGLYLYVEKGWSGAAIQKAHTHLARRKRAWPTILLPADRGAIRMTTVMDARAGEERDRMIERWCESIWQAYRGSHDQIRALAHEELGRIPHEQDR